MTFEQLQEIAKEQQTRTFSLDCALTYQTLPAFMDRHFRQLRPRVIEHSCWEALIKLTFPFEDVVVNIDFVLSEDKITPNLKTVTGVSFKFGIYLLNQACMSLDDMKKLIHNFIELFDRELTHTFQTPAELKTSIVIVNLHYTHSMFKTLHDNHLI
jgi:hypothetical protein